MILLTPSCYAACELRRLDLLAAAARAERLAAARAPAIAASAPGGTSISRLDRLRSAARAALVALGAPAAPRSGSPAEA